MGNRILIPLYKREVAPRFDLALEALIVSCGEEDSHGKGGHGYLWRDCGGTLSIPFMEKSQGAGFCNRPL